MLPGTAPSEPIGPSGAVPGSPPPLGPPPGPLAVSRTQTGLVLLAIAVLLSWIPLVEFLGLLAGAVGVIFILLGRGPFRMRHEVLVWASVGIYVLAYLGEIVLGMFFASSVRAIGNGTGSAAADAFLSAWRGLALGTLVAVAFISLSFALIAFELEDAPGRLLLVAGVVAQVVISAYLLLVVADPILQQAVTKAFASNPVDVSVLEAADAEVHGLGALTVLNAIPAVFFACAYVWARERLLCGAVPASSTPPQHASRALAALLLAVVVLTPAAGIAAVATGALPTSPPPPPTWRIVAQFTGTGLETTPAFRLNGTESRINSTFTSYNGGAYLAFSVYAVGSSTPAESCAGSAESASCGGPNAPGAYYLVVTSASNVASWTVTVWQYA